MRGIVTRLVLPFVAVAALAAVGTAGSASKAAPTFVFAGASDPTYLDPALVSDGESFRVTEQIFESLVSLKPGSTLIRPGLATKWGSSNGKDWTFNLIDTPGHADFGMEVESASRVVDGAVVLIDSVEGVEAQTKGVWQQLDR